MSTINRKPYIQIVLESLTQDNLTSLIGLVNGGEGAQIFRSLINDSYVLTTDDKGIKRIVLEAKDEVYTGYLIYTDTYCVIVAYNGLLEQKLKVLVLDYEDDTYEIVDEKLTIEEFRRLIEGRTTNLIVQANDVVANPTLAGTESALTGLEVDGTKYKVPHLYNHNLKISRSGNIVFETYIDIQTNFDAPISKTTFTSLLSQYQKICATGLFSWSRYGEYGYLLSFSPFSASAINVNYVQEIFSFADDTVTKTYQSKTLLCDNNDYSLTDEVRQIF